MSNYDTSFWNNGSPSPRRRKVRKKGGFGWRVILAGFFLLVFAATAVYGFGMARRLLEETFVPVEQTTEGSNVPDAGKSPYVNILLIGNDQRADEASRADTIIMAFLNKDTSELSLLSIPRDTRVEVPGHGMTKVNHAHAYGGPSLLQETVQQFLGVPVDYYAEVNFEGFANIVDILGGLELNVETRMYYPQEQIDLYPGKQVLNGSDALAYVRWRGDGRGDIGRIERQQKFLRAMADQTLNLATVLKIPKLVDQVAQYVRTDLPPKTLLPLTKAVAKMDSGGLKATTIPGAASYIDGVSYWLADAAQTKALIKELYPDQGDKTPTASLR